MAKLLTCNFAITAFCASALSCGCGNIRQPSSQVAERGEFRYPWVNLLDLRVAKSFSFGATRFEPMLDLYNVFNNNAPTNVVQTVGTSLGRPSAIVMARLLRIGGRISF